MGFHTIIAVFLAALIKWNKIAAAIAVWITNPFTAPLIYPLTYFIGSKFVKPQHRYQLPDELNLSVILSIIQKAPEVVFIFIIGGAVIGIPLAIVGYALAYSAIINYREKIKASLAQHKPAFIRKRKKGRSKARHSN